MKLRFTSLATGDAFQDFVDLLDAACKSKLITQENKGNLVAFLLSNAYNERDLLEMSKKLTRSVARRGCA